MWLHSGLGRSLGLLHLIRNILPNTLLNLLNLLGIGESSINESTLYKLEGITCGSSQGNLLTVTVGCSGVGHGVTVVTIGHHLHVHGSISISNVILDKPHSLLDSQDVHTINPHSRNVISHLVIIRMRRVTIHTSSHAVMVVLDTKDHGKLPQTGHIGRLPNLSLIGSSIPITRNGNLHRLARSGIIMISKRQPKPHGNLSPHNPLPTKEVMSLVIKMHRPSLPLRLSIHVSKQLSQNTRHGPSPCQRRTVTPIRRNPRVLRVKSRIDTGSHGLLPIVQVTKSANGTSLVFIITRDFHTTHGVHEFKVG
mmetsp:Transcript_2041/g.4486  ORF Transcript_2041/g.4486 Transcript_2041/m.4486 type:complete len:309 (+) Transcript_2041:311-1237(+)